MPTSPDLDQLSQTELIGLVRNLIRRIEKLELENTTLKAENTRLKNENSRLQSELEKLKRQQARSATPFSRNQPKPHPQPPGRKKGLGVFKYRQRPEASDVSEIVEVPAPETCPECQTSTTPIRIALAWVTDLPEIKPVITEYRFEVSACPTCGMTLRGEHPLIPNSQRGASAHRFGPRILALTSALRFDFGVTSRRVPEMMLEFFNVRLTHSALVQSAITNANESQVIGAQYVKLRTQVRHASVVNTDDTSWALHGRNAFLMAFKTNSSVVYQIREQHRTIEVLELIPAGFNGVLVADRFGTYDAKALGNVKHQKCVAHLLKNLKLILEKRKRGRSHVFALALRAVFKQSLRLHSRFVTGGIEESVFKRQGRVLTRRLDRLLEFRELKDKDNARLLGEFSKHHARGSLLRFLEDPSVSPTNNAAERALRPAVIARKLSAGSKNERGALAFAAFKSVIETGKLFGVSGFGTLLEAYSHPRR